MTGTPPHATWLSTVYAWLGRHTFYNWPSAVTEVVGGVVLFLVALGIVLLATGHRAIAVLLLATAGNVLWALKLDPNDAGKKSELPDGGIREGVLVVLVLVAHLAFAL